MRIAQFKESTACALVHGEGAGCLGCCQLGLEVARLDFITNPRSFMMHCGAGLLANSCISSPSVAENIAFLVPDGNMALEVADPQCYLPCCSYVRWRSILLALLSTGLGCCLTVLGTDVLWHRSSHPTA